MAQSQMKEVSVGNQTVNIALRPVSISEVRIWVSTLDRDNPIRQQIGEYGMQWIGGYGTTNAVRGLSYEQAGQYAKHQGARLPTIEELHAFQMTIPHSLSYRQRFFPWEMSSDAPSFDSEAQFLSELTSDLTKQEGITHCILFNPTSLRACGERLVPTVQPQLRATFRLARG